MALSNFPSTAVRDSRDDDKEEEEGEQNTRYTHEGRTTASKFNLDEYGLRRSNVQYKDIDAPRRHEMKKERTNCLFCLPTRPRYIHMSGQGYVYTCVCVSWRGARFGTTAAHASRRTIWKEGRLDYVRLRLDSLPCREGTIQ